MKKTFTAHIHSGNKFKFDSPERWRDTLEKLDGEKVFVRIEKWYAKGSDKQRKYYWGIVVETLSNETGFEPSEMHDYLKAKFNSKVEVINSVKITRVLSTESLTTVEREAYHTKIRNWSADMLNCYIPLPNEDRCPEEFRY